MSTSTDGLLQFVEPPVDDKTKKKKVNIVAIIVVLLLIYIAISMFYTGIISGISQKFYKSRPIPWQKNLIYSVTLFIVIWIVAYFTEFPLTRLIENSLE